MKKYEEYKASKYDWLGSVPSQWSERSVRSLTHLSDERNGNRNDLELLSVYREYGVIRKNSRDDNHNVESADLSNYKVVHKNYLVLNKMKAWQGSMGISHYEGIVSPAYIVCSLAEDINPTYLHYLLRSKPFITEYNRLSYGIRVGQWDMRYDDFKNILLYTPSQSEQAQIVKYLDWKVSKINKYIKAKKRQIELLKELKQAEINRAVTKGLDPNVPLKDTQNNWIDSIPSHWKEKYLFQIAKERKVSNKKMYNQNLLSLSYGNIVNKDINQTEGLLPASYDTYQIINDGNIVLRLTDLQNDQKSLRVGLSSQEGIITSAYTCLECVGDALPEYIYYLLHSYDISKIFYGMGGGLRQSMGYKEIKKLIAYTFSKEEQQQIVLHCNYIVNQKDKAVERLNETISYLEELRSSLISDIVTGKVDVRDIEVPDDYEVGEVSDEIDNNMEETDNDE